MLFYDKVTLKGVENAVLGPSLFEKFDNSRKKFKWRPPCDSCKDARPAYQAINHALQPEQLFSKLNTEDLKKIVEVMQNLKMTSKIGDQFDNDIKAIAKFIKDPSNEENIQGLKLCSVLNTDLILPNTTNSAEEIVNNYLITKLSPNIQNQFDANQLNSVMISNITMIRSKINNNMRTNNLEIEQANKAKEKLKDHPNSVNFDQKTATLTNENKKFAENDRIYFLKNDRQIGVKNGSLGIIEKIDNNLLTIKVDKSDTQSLEDSKVTIDLNKYNHIDYGYAATIHKAQGVTVDRCYLLASKHMDRHATYVGMSRHRESADLFWSREEFSNEKSLCDTLKRERAKDVTLDYSHQQIRDNFATHRNIEISEPLAKEINRTLPEKEINQEFYKEKGFVAEKIKDNDLTKMYIQDLRKDIDEIVGFNKYCENKSLEVNKELSDNTLTEFEKRAILVEKTVRNLYSQSKQDPQNLDTKNELKNLLTKVSRDKQLMENLKERAPALTQRIKALTKEKSLSRGVRLSRF